MLNIYTRVGLAGLVLLTLGGCVVHDYDRPTRGRVVVEKDYYYDRDYNDRRHHRYERHCPPGHYKKGWC